MKNIGRVFWNDCKHIGRNVVALIVVMGLAVLPSLYAWFNYIIKLGSIWFRLNI